MNWRKFCGLFSLGTLVLGLAGCAELFPETYRFRLTVEVDTPQGLRSGSSVYEVWANNKTALLPDEAKRDWGVRGEAVAVELPDGRILFALLRTSAIHEDMAGLSMTALDPAFNNDIVESAARIASGEGVRQQAEVAAEDYPLLVTFRDIRDPGSVEEVDPYDLRASFGQGFALRRMTARRTEEKISTDIERYFPWWSDYRNLHFDGTSSNLRDVLNKRLAAHLTIRNFSTEIDK